MWILKKILINSIIVLLLIAIGGFLFYKHNNLKTEVLALNKIIDRLSNSSRIAEIYVTSSEYDDISKKTKTTIKFLEYGLNNIALEPKYFTFSDNIIQFQSLVIRFNDKYIKSGDRYKGKSVFFFWKVFYLDGKNTEEFLINKLNSIPTPYAINKDKISLYEIDFWHKFWEYVHNEKLKEQQGIKNAQIEAHGIKFLPGYIYTIRIENDGGLRIDSSALPKILIGEL